MTRRASLNARLARLEANRPPQWTAPLEGGGTLTLALTEALRVMSEGISAVAAIAEGEPFPDPSLALRRASHVRPDYAATSLIDGVLVESARAVRAHLEGATRP